MEEKFDYVKRGYDPKQVNEYIDTLETVIKGYKNKEDLILKAIISAQAAADGIIKNAEARAEKIETRALQRQDAILAAIEEQKDSLYLFQEKYNTLLKKYLHPNVGNEISRITSEIDDLRDYAVGFKESKSSDVGEQIS